MNTKIAQTKQENSWPIYLVIGLTALVSVVGLFDRLLFDPVDWWIYRQALNHPLDPYRLDFFNPPWAMWFLFPFRGLPQDVGWVRLITLLVFFALVWRQSEDIVKALLLATSVPLLYLIANANIDFLPALAFLLPNKGWAFVLLTIKPQTGVLAVLAWLKRIKSWKAALGLLLPFLALLVVSLFLYGFWPAAVWRNMAEMQNVGLTRVSWNTSLFPWSIPLGVYFAWRTWKEMDEFYGVTASALLSPYLPLYSLSLWYALFLGRASRLSATMVWVGFWLIYIGYFLGWSL